MDIAQSDTAIVITDPQNDFLSPDGVAWGLVGASVEENNTVANLGSQLESAQANGYTVFVSPHYYYPTDKDWQFGGTVEVIMHDINMFDRTGTLTMDGFAGSGADWIDELQPYLEADTTVVTNPHKVYSPASNDLSLQLRKRGFDKVVLGGMSANLCVESHLRQLLEDGFEVAVVKDATAAAQHPDLGDGYAAAVVNFGYLASEVLSTKEAVDRLV